MFILTIVLSVFQFMSFHNPFVIFKLSFHSDLSKFDSTFCLCLYYPIFFLFLLSQIFLLIIHYCVFANQWTCSYLGLNIILLSEPGNICFSLPLLLSAEWGFFGIILHFIILIFVPYFFIVTFQICLYYISDLFVLHFNFVCITFQFCWNQPTFFSWLYCRIVVLLYCCIVVSIIC